jgi:hypothetical protein
MARTATTAFQPTAEHAAAFGSPHGFPIQLSNSQAKNSQTVIASHRDAKNVRPMAGSAKQTSFGAAKPRKKFGWRRRLSCVPFVSSQPHLNVHPAVPSPGHARRCRVHRISSRVSDDRDTPLIWNETSGDPKLTPRDIDLVKERLKRAGEIHKMMSGTENKP